jgi:hypothetical protein
MRTQIDFYNIFFFKKIFLFFVFYEARLVSSHYCRTLPCKIGAVVTFEQPQANKTLASAQTAGVEGLQSLVAHHNLTVTHTSRSWQALRQSVSKHIGCAEGNKLDDTSTGKLKDVCL